MTARIALMMPKDTAFYRQLAIQMGRGFQQEGWTVVTGYSLLTGAALIQFCEEFKPDVLFEMNRPRCDIPELPLNIRHIAWIVDTNGRANDYFVGSEITYYWGANWFLSRPKSAYGFSAWLPPGVCSVDYRYGTQDKVCDFSYVGHMPQPWSQQEKDRIVSKGLLKIQFGELLEDLERMLIKNNLRGFSNDDYLAMAESLIGSLGAEIADLDDALRYDLGCRIVRQHTRQTITSLALKSSSSVAFYGSKGWLAWPAYKAYYKGFLTQAKQLRDVYQTSRINLHDGVGIHFRTMDCMGSGGLLFYLGSADDDAFGGMHTFFEPDKHFVRVDTESFSDKADFYLRHPKLRQKIAQSASALVHAKHSWRQRASTVIKDLAAL